MQKRHAVSNLILVSLVVFPALSINTAQVEAKPAASQTNHAKARAKRLSVIDYFYLLPSLGIGDQATQSEKRELLQPQNHPIIDVRSDYLLVHPDSSPAEQIAVFRARGKADLLAVSMPDFKSDYNFFALYRLQNGKLQDVTGQMLPVQTRTNDFLYELPRVGTAIRVFSFDLHKESRRYAFCLQWSKGHFVKVR